MQVRELRQKIESLQATLSTWGARSGDVGDLARLTEALRAFDDLTVASFCAQLGRLSEGGADAPRPRAARAAARVDEALVARYLAMFSADELDYAGLQAALGELKSNKMAKVPELTAIASQLAGSEGKYNKRTALEKIETVVRRRLDTARRLEGTSGIF